MTILCRVGTLLKCSAGKPPCQGPVSYLHTYQTLLLYINRIHFRAPGDLTVSANTSTTQSKEKRRLYKSLSRRSTSNIPDWHVLPQQSQIMFHHQRFVLMNSLKFFRIDSKNNQRNSRLLHN